MAPEWEKAAKALKGVVKFGAVNADEASNQEIANKYEIKGFPTVKIFTFNKKNGPV